MKKIYTGEIRKMTVKQVDPNPSALKKIAFESTTVKKDALFYVNLAGVTISVDYNTKLPNRDEAEYYLTSCVERIPESASYASCLYQGPNFTFSHEMPNEELKKLLKTKQAERKGKK